MNLQERREERPLTASRSSISGDAKSRISTVSRCVKETEKEGVRENAHYENISCYSCKKTYNSYVAQDFPNLKVLSMSINNISSLAACAHCKSLEEIFIRHNKVTFHEIHLHGLSQLPQKFGSRNWFLNSCPVLCLSVFSHIP
jgi:hypothetical protein